MKTLIIPCAGRSSRFPNMKPKWMLCYPDGKIMVKKALEGMDISEYDRIIITILQEHVVEFDADKILYKAFCFEDDSRYELCVLEEPTSCQAETVYLTLLNCNVQGAFSVKDSDNYIKCNLLDKLDFVVGINLTVFPKEVRRLAAKSFLVMNEQNIIIDIIEKKIVSENISVGLYGFRDVSLFVDTYLYLQSVNTQKYEIYISHIIAYLLGSGESVYEYIEAQDYEDWGTLDDWNLVLNEKSTLIINIDNILFKSEENYKRYLDIENQRPRKDNLAFLKNFTEKGGQIIALTSRHEEERLEVINSLLQEGVCVHALIMDCYLSHEILVNSYGNDLPYPGCEHINIKANDYLGDFLRI